ncbi:MAG TPA: GMC family oxidoreductase [Vicinamibacterales bacterium]|nr:GMC family oxidoreductase [Vicinamibacterales bacterium]
MARYEADVVIIGGGITAAMVAQKLRELRPQASVIVVEAGKRLFDFENRFEYRQRNLDYGENHWPGDFISDQNARGIISRTQAVGGSALHWGGVCNRFSEEDTRLKSMYGLAVDWPIEWADLEKHYCEAERRLGVSGEPSPLKEDWRSEPYPMPAMTSTFNLKELKTWAEQSGIPFWTTPQAKNTVDGYGGRGKCRRCNTCEICPTGARYSPDWTFKQLLDLNRAGDGAATKFQLHDQTLIRRLVLDPSTPRIAAATGAREDGGDDNVEYRASTFVLASGYTWSPHLLLASANSRFPNGLANSSDHVGRYMTGHLAFQTTIDLNLKIYPGMNEQHSLISRQFFRCRPDQPYVRHDLRVWENAGGRAPSMRDRSGKLLLGDALIADWRTRLTRGTARVRGYFDVHPDKDSRLTLDPANKNRWGDPMPVVQHRTDAATQARTAATRQHFEQLFAQLAKANDGRMGNVSGLNYQDHPAGGCRMGTDPSTSVVDSHGRTHDHENLFVVGSPTMPTGGCTNGTLTFVALALRSAAQIAGF